MVALCNAMMKQMDLRGEAETVFSPDYCLAKITEGVICTADSHVIDTALVPTLDLARQVLETNFKLKIFSLKSYLLGE
jgi:hypothetical protein